MDAPPPIVSCRLFAAPDVLEDILFEACHAHDESIPKPPFNLPSIALTCRTTSSIVSPKFNPRFYARLFRATFDLPVQLSPCFPCDPSLLTEELPQLWQSLNRLRKSSLQASSSEVLEEDMLIACAMLLQHPTGQTKNRRALLDYAHVDAVSLQLILSRTDKPEYMEHCRRTPIILCALWLLWITSSHGFLSKLPLETRNVILSLCENYAFTPHIDSVLLPRRSSRLYGRILDPRTLHLGPCPSILLILSMIGQNPFVPPPSLRKSRNVYHKIEDVPEDELYNRGPTLDDYAKFNSLPPFPMLSSADEDYCGISYPWALPQSLGPAAIEKSALLWTERLAGLWAGRFLFRTKISAPIDDETDRPSTSPLPISPSKSCLIQKPLYWRLRIHDRLSPELVEELPDSLRKLIGISSDNPLNSPFASSTGRVQMNVGSDANQAHLAPKGEASKVAKWIWDRAVHDTWPLIVGQTDISHYLAWIPPPGPSPNYLGVVRPWDGHITLLRDEGNCGKWTFEGFLVGGQENGMYSRWVGRWRGGSDTLVGIFGMMKTDME